MRRSSVNNISKGSRAKQEGEAFENFFANSCRAHGIYVIHLPMGGRPKKAFNPYFKRWEIKLIPVKMPFDFILSKPGKLSAYVDTKSISDDRVVYSFLTPHQVDILSDLESHGHKAGYVVHFKKTNKVVFYRASLLQSLRSRESLTQEEGEYMGQVFQLNLRGFL